MRKVCGWVTVALDLPTIFEDRTRALWEFICDRSPVFLQIKPALSEFGVGARVPINYIDVKLMNIFVVREMKWCAWERWGGIVVPECVPMLKVEFFEFPRFWVVQRYFVSWPVLKSRAMLMPVSRD